MNAQTSKKIREIVDPIYKKWKPRLFRYDLVAPDLREENLRKANDESLPEYVRRRHQNLHDAGAFDAKEMVIDQEAADKYEKEIDRAIKKAIDSGYLPKAKTPAIMKKLMSKSKQYGKRKAEGGKPTK